MLWKLLHNLLGASQGFQSEPRLRRSGHQTLVGELPLGGRSITVAARMVYTICENDISGYLGMKPEEIQALREQGVL